MYFEYPNTNTYKVSGQRTPCITTAQAWSLALLNSFTFSAEIFPNSLFNNEFKKWTLLNNGCKSENSHDYKDFQDLISYPSKQISTS